MLARLAEEIAAGRVQVMPPADSWLDAEGNRWYPADPQTLAALRDPPAVQGAYTPAAALP